MPYLGAWQIDSWLTFYCNTHRAATGAAADALAVPAYRIYEDEAGLVIGGNMALYDAGATTGWYSERLQLTAAAGFELGKMYAIYIEATDPDGVVGTMHHTFQIGTVAAQPAALAAPWTYTVTDTADGLPEAGVTVWISTDVAGANVIWAGISDAFGVARDTGGLLPILSPGTYYIWKSKVGFTPDVFPDTETAP